MFRLKAMTALLLALCMFLPGCGQQEQDDSLISEELIVPEKVEYETTEENIRIIVNNKDTIFFILYSP